MNKLKTLEIFNGLAFQHLELNLDQPGMNLILGTNKDDLSGNDSRNATGKSSIFKLVNCHLIGSKALEGFKVNDIINDKIRKNYRSVLNWGADGIDNFSYQFRKDKEWGTGVELWRGGPHKTEKAENISMDGNDATQIKILKEMRLTPEEWLFLSSMVDVLNDIHNPFFSTDKSKRMSLIQNLYGLDYSYVREVNKKRNSVNNKKLTKAQVSFDTSHSLISEQIQDLPPVEELEQVKEKAELDLAGVKQTLTKLRQKHSDFKNKLDLVARYKHLKESLAEIGDRNIPQEIENTSQNLLDAQSIISQLTKRAALWVVYSDKSNDYEAQKAKVSAFLDSGIKKDNVDTKISDINKDIQKVMKISSCKALYKSYITEAVKKDLEISHNPLVAASEAAIKTTEEYNQKHLKVSKEIEEIEGDIFYLTTLINLIKDRDSTLQKDFDLNQYPIELVNTEIDKLTQNITDISINLSDINKFIDSFNGGNCPTCDQAWANCSQEDYQKQELRKQTLDTELSEKQSNLESYKWILELAIKYNNTLDKLESHLQKRDMLDDLAKDIQVLNTECFMQEFELKLVEMRSSLEMYENVLEKNAEIYQILEPLKNVSDEDLTLAQMSDDNLVELNTTLNYFNDAKKSFSLSKELEVSLDKARGALGEISENETIQSIKNDTENKQKYQQELQVYLKWAQSIVADYNEFNSDKFENIINLMHIEDENVFSLETDIGEKEKEESSIQQIVSDNKAKIVQRKDLELQLAKIEIQKDKLTALKKKATIHKAIEFLTGPRGLIVPRIEGIFYQINKIMNFYLSILVQDGIHKNESLNAAFKMSDNAPDLFVYRGDREISKKALSDSEKVRVKLASCLAFREFLPAYKYPNVLFLDEIDGSACEVNSERIWECIEIHVKAALEKGQNISVWAVSHSETIQKSTIWNTIHMVTKKDGFATIEKIE